MADNTLQGGTDTIATDDLTTLNGGAVSGFKVQRVKVGFGSDAILRDVDATNGLPVVLLGTVSTANSSTATLGIGAVFTGTSEDISNYATVTVTVFADQASATDGLQIQQSSNGTNWDNMDAYTVPASTGKTFKSDVGAKFLRLVYTNGGVAQTAFRLQTIYSQVGHMGSSVRPQDARSNENDMRELVSFAMTYNGATWDRQRGTIANGALVDVSRLPALTKGTQGATGVSTQNLKDAGRVTISMTAEFSPALIAEALLSMSISKDGATPTTATSYVPTAGKRFRLSSLMYSVENTLGTSVQRSYLRYRMAVTGGLLVTSPLQVSMAAAASGTVKSMASTFLDIPDGMEILGDGTKAIGFTEQTPDWVVSVATSKIYVTAIGFEY